MPDTLENETHSDKTAREPSPVFMLLPEVIQFTTLSKSVIRRRVRQDDFPAPVRLSPNRVAWRRDEVERWQENLERAVA